MSNPSPVSSVGPGRTCSQPDAPTHSVAAGESWFAIAESVDVKLGSLFKINRATEDSPIYPGDVICLPGVPKVPTGGSSDSPGSCPSSTASTHTVVAGDSWFGIARAAGLKVGSLFKANGATEDSPIHPGDVICLPAAATPSIASSTTPVPKGGGAMRALPAQGPCLYTDTWLAPRGGDRRHEGIDLITKAGHYVYAVVDGTLTRRYGDQQGLLSGNAWWLTSADGSGTSYFYAHLSGFASGLKAGSKVAAGQIIGFVGSTGNTTLPHLHFEIHPNGGNAINPYRVINAMGGCNIAPPYQQPGG